MMEDNNNDVVDAATAALEYMQREDVLEMAGGAGPLAQAIYDLRAFVGSVSAAYRSAMADLKGDGARINEMNRAYAEMSNQYALAQATADAKSAALEAAQAARDRLWQTATERQQQLDNVFDVIREAVIDGGIDINATWLRLLEKYGFTRESEREVTITVWHTVRGTVTVPLGMDDDEVEQYICDEFGFSLSTNNYSKKIGWSEYDCENDDVSVNID